MKIKDYLKKLLPVFGRDRLQEDIGMLTNELNTILLPSFQLAIEQNGSQRFNSMFYKDIERNYKMAMGSMKGNVLNDVYLRVQKLPESLSVLAKISQDEFQNKIVSEAMTARKANVLRAVECVGFINKYAMSLFNAVITKEIEAVKSTEPSADITTGELKRLQKLLPDFAILLRALSDPKSIDSVISSMPEVAVDDSVFSESFGEDNDPLNLFQADNFKGNPMYAVGMIVAEWQNRRYKHLLEQRKALELRLMHMKRRAEKTEDPVLEAEIEQTSRRVAGMAAQIRDYEESLG